MSVPEKDPEKNTPSSRRAKCLGVFAAALTGAVSVLTAYVALGNVGATPITLPYLDRVQLFAPEGWKFFTKNAHDDRFEALVLEGDRWETPFANASADPSYAFGANRTGRARGVEVGLLMEKLSKDQWKECTGNPRDCLSADGIVAHVQNESPAPALCGSVGIVTAPPVPWAWSRNKKPVQMPSRVARLVVQC
jgi:antimicrobial peptide system SdpA family protein